MTKKKMNFWETERADSVDLSFIGKVPPEVSGFVGMTKDGDLVDPNGFVKHDDGKPRFELIPAEALLEVAKAFTHGAKEYPPDNYRIGTEWRRYVGALHRHMNAWMLREEADPKSGLNHLSHAIASLMILLTLQLTNKGVDDRPKP